MKALYATCFKTKFALLTSNFDTNKFQKVLGVFDCQTFLDFDQEMFACNTN